MPKGKPFPEEVRGEAILRIIDGGEKYHDVADSVGCNHAVLREWVRKYRAREGIEAGRGGQPRKQIVGRVFKDRKSGWTMQQLSPPPCKGCHKSMPWSAQFVVCDDKGNKKGLFHHECAVQEITNVDNDAPVFKVE